MEVVDACEVVPVVDDPAEVAPEVVLPPAVVEAVDPAVVEPPTGALVETPWPTQAVLARESNKLLNPISINTSIAYFQPGRGRHRTAQRHQ